MKIFCLKNRSLLIFASLIPSFCFASWISSGGELLKDARNPWFVKSTRQVRYCVNYGSGGFSVSREQSVVAIEKAISDWKHEFLMVPSELASTGIGAQEFIRVDDCNSAELRFQLGEKTLDQQQRAFIGHPRDYVGLAVRTSYDRVHLKGRGFIFINSDIGPESFEHAGGSAGVWQKEGVLYAVLMHELGHVFGIGHEGRFSIMSEDFPEIVVKNPNMLAGSSQGSLPTPAADFNFFKPSPVYFDCLVDKAKVREWFGLPKANTLGSCLTIILQGDARVSEHAEVFEDIYDIDPNQKRDVGASSHIAAFENPSKNTRRKIGDIFFQPGSWEPVEEISHIAVMVRLTPEQKVFTTSADSIIGPLRPVLSSKGIYVPIDHPENNRPVRMRIGSIEEFELLGKVDGAIERLLKGIF